jgi:hypothetical protein
MLSHICGYIICKQCLRAGGIWKYVMHLPVSKLRPIQEFNEIVPTSKFAFPLFLRVCLAFHVWFADMSISPFQILCLAPVACLQHHYLSTFTDRFQPRLIVSYFINKGIYASKIIVGNLKKYMALGQAQWHNGQTKFHENRSVSSEVLKGATRRAR